MPELIKTKCDVQWWEDNESMSNETVKVEISYDDGSIYIDGLRDEKYLSLPLKVLAQAIADNA
jgi:hypothetical protein